MMFQFTEIPPDHWPHVEESSGSIRIKVFRSDTFLVQVFSDPSGYYRISVNCISQKHGAWRDGITWDQLQAIKKAIGYGDLCAVELYPPEKDVVNVANFRHLFILQSPPPFMWIDGKAKQK